MTKQEYKYQNKNLIEAAAEQWVNLVMAHIAAKRKNGKVITNYKKENKYGAAST